LLCGLCVQGETSETVTDTASSPGAQVNPQSKEAHSSQIAVDSVAPSASSKPAAEPTVASVENAASTQNNTETASAPPPAKPSEKSRSEDTQHNDQVEGTKPEPEPEPSPEITSPEAKSQLSADANQQPTAAVDKIVSDNDGKLTEPGQATESNEPAAVGKTVSADNNRSTELSQVTAAEAEVKDQAPVEDNSKSDGSTDSPVEPADSAVDSAEQVADSAAAAAADDDDEEGVKQHLTAGKHTEEHSEHVKRAVSEHSASQDNSEQTDAHEARDESNDSAEPTSEDVSTMLNRADSEVAMDGQSATAAVDKGTANAYLVPLVNLWAAADAWLITCIHSVSRESVMLLPVRFSSFICIGVINFVEFCLTVVNIFPESSVF